jgi:(1->4)-alpha-D-glucan 1-alpha-D-glucosylmutase
MPEEWNRALHRWRELNHRRKSSVEGAAAPDANEEYLIYQTLVGTWPLEGVTDENRGDYTRRLQEYIGKALKEAKLHTSWINPHEGYERAVSDFVASLLDPALSGDFIRDFEEFRQLPTRAGLLNSLSQTLLKAAAPGVPDFYQGTELWAFTLVDPDNRRPVDYELRRQQLASLRDVGEGDVSEFVEALLERPGDGRVKMYVTARALNFRRARAALFARGEYRPLPASGRRAANVVSFARALDAEAAVVVAARFFTRLGVGREGALSLRREAWGDTTLQLAGVEGGRYRDFLTGREYATRDDALPVGELLSPLPVALLARVSG